jgi:hypothetical protein
MPVLLEPNKFTTFLKVDEKKQAATVSGCYDYSCSFEKRGQKGCRMITPQGVIIKSIAGLD